MRATVSPWTRLVTSVLVLALLAYPIPARAYLCVPSAGMPAAAPAATTANRVIYVHGRSMWSWPTVALLRTSTSWSHQWLVFNGSERLANPSIRTQLRTTIKDGCTGTKQCVIVCYSTGCARTLLALDELRAANTPATRLLWIEAIASAAGGTDVAVQATKWYMPLLSKLSGSDDSAKVDVDLTPASMRSTYGYLQNGAGAPMYHYAGNKDICQRFSVSREVVDNALTAAKFAYDAYQKLSALSAGTMTSAGSLTTWFDPTTAIVTFVIIKVIAWMASKISVRLCGNTYLPGGMGDGAVPVASAAGYADNNAHTSHNDGGAKFLWRTSAQVPLYTRDHRGMVEVGVEAASLRLATTANITIDDAPPVPQNIPKAPLTTEDGDAVPDTVGRAAVIAAMPWGGQSLYTGSPTLHATCRDGACDQSVIGNETYQCGEASCKAVEDSWASHYTNADCTGAEYAAENFEGCNDGTRRTWDASGIVGGAATCVRTYSYRTEDGVCHQANDWNTNPATGSLACHHRLFQVYRAAYVPPPPPLTCGEASCTPVTTTGNSYFASANCTSGESTEFGGSWDGGGLLGATTACHTDWVSRRQPGGGCVAFSPPRDQFGRVQCISGRRIYR